MYFLHFLCFCVVGAAGEGGALDPGKAQVFCGLCPGVEFVRMDVLDNVQRVFVGFEVLADGQAVAADAAQVFEDVQNLRVGFAQPQHDGGFGLGVGPAGVSLFQQVQRPPVVSAGPGNGVQGWDGFDIMAEDKWTGRVEDVQCLVLAIAEIRHEQFILQFRAGGPAGVDDIPKMPRAAIGQVIAVHTGDDQESQIHFHRHRRDTGRLGGVGGFGLAVADGAEFAVACADVAED